MGSSIFGLKIKNGIASIIAEGGILTCLTVLLTWLSYILPVIDLFQYLALTPIIIAGIMRGLRFSVQVAVASTLLVGMTRGFFPSGLIFIIAVAPLGVVLGHIYQKNIEAKRIILVSIIVQSLSTALLAWISIKISGLDMQKEIHSMAKTFHIDPFKLAESFLLLLPFIIFLTSLCNSLYIWIFNTYVLKKLKMLNTERPYFIDIFYFMNVPSWFCIIFFFGIAFFIADHFLHIYILKSIGINLIFITSTVFFFKGMFLINMLIRERISKGLSFILFLFYITIGMPIAVMAGLTSTLMNRDF